MTFNPQHDYFRKRGGGGGGLLVGVIEKRRRENKKDEHDLPCYTPLVSRRLKGKGYDVEKTPRKTQGNGPVSLKVFRKNVGNKKKGGKAKKGAHNSKRWQL